MEFEVNKIMMVGDTHGSSERLNEIITAESPDILIILGDGGFYWPERDYHSGAPRIRMDDRNLQDLVLGDTKVFWLPGNHEPWDFLERKYGRYGVDPLEVIPNLWYCPIGSHITVNGANILFIGGADSVDKAYRKRGLSWWAEEILTEKDYAWLLANSLTITSYDIVCAHTCPSEFNIAGTLKQGTGLYADKFTDPTRDVLSKVLNVVNPSYWFFGHWHLYQQGAYAGVQWTALNTITPGYEEGGRSQVDVSGLFYTDADVSSEDPAGDL